MGLNRWLILVLISAMALFSCSEDPDVLFSKAETEAALGSKQQALNYLMKIQKSSPQYTEAYLFAARLFFEDKNLSEAINQCKRGLDAKADSAQILRYIGEIYYLSGSMESAYQYYRMAVEADDNNVEAHISYGLVLNQKELFKQALTHFDKALELDSANYAATMGKAQTLIKTNKNTEAIVLLEAAVEDEPMKGPAYGILAIAQENTSIEKKAILDNYALAVKLEPKNKTVWKAYVSFMIKDQEKQDAIQVIKSYLNFYPDASDARHDLANLYIDLAQVESLSWLEAARQQCEQAIMINGNDHYAHALLARIYLLQEKPRLATLEAQLAFEINPITVYRELVDQAKFFSK